MKKIVFSAVLTLVLALLPACNEEKSSVDLFQVSVDQDETIAGSEDNELYNFIKAEFGNIGNDLDKSRFDNEVAATELYEETCGKISILKEKMDVRKSSGDDFGSTSFSFDSYCLIYKNGQEIKRSDLVKFEYRSNTRIELSDTTFRITYTAGKVTDGKFKVPISEKGAELEIVGRSWKIYRDGGKLSESQMQIVTNVTVVTENGQTYFEIEYNVPAAGVNAGQYYLLFTSKDGDDRFDWKVNLDIDIETGVKSCR